MKLGILRAAGACTVAATLILPVLPTMACGPDFSPPVFVQKGRPDMESGQYALGRLGVVLPSYGPSYLAVAYRYLSGKALSASEQSQLADLWNESSGGDNQQQADVSDSSGWDQALQEWAQKANVAIPAPPENPQANRGMAYLSQTYQSYSNCYTDAYATAANTLRAREQEFGDDSPAVKSWVTAQISVFQNCAAPGLATPDPASSDLPMEIRKDRDYQIAAADFYGDDWDNAEKEFLAIAADPSSQWRAIGGLVAARCEIRKATLGTDDPDARRTMFQGADAQLKKIIADPVFASVQSAAESLRGFVEFRAYPEGRALDLSELIAGGTDPDRFGQELHDYSKLMEQQEYPLARDPAQRAKSDMTDWIASYAVRLPGSTDDHNVTRWQQTHSLAWLVAALGGAQPNTPQLAALLQASQAVGQDSSAYLTLAFQRDRLLGEMGNGGQARRDLDRVLAMPDDAMSVSSRNLFLALRMQVAANFDEFLRYAPRQEAAAATDFGGGQANDATDQKMFDEDAAQVFNQMVPLNMVADAAESTALSDPLRNQLAMAAWTRAVILHDDPIARRVAPTLMKLEPDLKDEFAPYLGAQTAQDREFAGVFILLHAPGLGPRVLTGLGRVGPDGNEGPLVMGLYGENWWCSLAPVPPNSPGGGYRPDFNGVLSIIGPVLSPGFLTAEQKTRGASEWAKLQTIPSGADWLIEQTVAWAKLHPRDARVPEALHLGVMATRHGCGDEGTSALSKQAFGLLHRRYPTSDWTKQTPYWFN